MSFQQAVGMSFSNASKRRSRRLKKRGHCVPSPNCCDLLNQGPQKVALPMRLNMVSSLCTFCNLNHSAIEDAYLTEGVFCKGTKGHFGIEALFNYAKAVSLTMAYCFSHIERAFYKASFDSQHDEKGCKISLTSLFIVFVS
jgi:hypothetical protein